MKWTSFVIGLITGLLCGLLVFTLWGSRYEVTGEGRSLYIKTDTWSGKTWLLSEVSRDTDSYWEEIKHRK